MPFKMPTAFTSIGTNHKISFRPKEDAELGEHQVMQHVTVNYQDMFTLSQ